MLPQPKRADELIWNMRRRGGRDPGRWEVTTPATIRLVPILYAGMDAHEFDERFPYLWDVRRAWRGETLERQATED